MKKLEIDLRLDMDERFPLHLHYDGQFEPQPCGFELDLESGKLTTFINGEIGNAVPEPVWNNRVLRFKISPYLMPKDIKNLAEDSKERFQEILEGAEVVWNDSNWIGRLSDRAWELHDEWNDLCLGYEDSVLLTVEEQMQFLEEPKTLADLNSLVEELIAYDEKHGGNYGYYKKEPDADWIEREVIDWLIEYRLQQWEPISQEMAQLIIDREIDVDERFVENLQLLADGKAID